MYRKINIIAYIKDELKQLDWLNATDMWGDTEVTHYLQTKEGKFYSKEDVIGYSEHRLENINPLKLEQVLKDASEIIITSEGSIDGSVVCFSGALHTGGQPIWELDGNLLGALLRESFTWADHPKNVPVRIVINATGSGVNKTNKPLSEPGDSFIQKVAEQFQSAYYMLKVEVEGRAGQVVHDNNSLYYGMTFPYDYILMHELNTVELKIINGYLKYSYILEEQITEGLITAWLVESMLSEIGLTVPEIAEVLSDKDAIARKVTAALLENKRICSDENYRLAPAITAQIRQDKGNSLQTSWGYNQGYQTDMHGALGEPKDIAKKCISDKLKNINNQIKKLSNINADVNNIIKDFDKEHYSDAKNSIKNICDQLEAVGQTKLLELCNTVYIEMTNMEKFTNDSFKFNQGCDFLEYMSKYFREVSEVFEKGGCSSLTSLFAGCERPYETMLKLKNILRVLDYAHAQKRPNAQELTNEAKVFISLLAKCQYDNANFALSAGNVVYVKETDNNFSKYENINKFVSLLDKQVELFSNHDRYYASLEIRGIETVGHAISCSSTKNGSNKSYTIFDPNVGSIECINEQVFKDTLDYILTKYERSRSLRNFFRPDNYVRIGLFSTLSSTQLTAQKIMETYIDVLYDKIANDKNLSQQISVHDKLLGGSPREETWKVPGQEDMGSLEGKPLVSNEEKRIIVQMQGDETSFEAARDLFMKDPRNSNWVQGRDEFGGMVLSLEDNKLTAGKGFVLEHVKDIKLVLVGHGSEFEGEKTLGSLTGKEIGERLNRLFENKINSGKPESLKISLVGCNLGEEGANWLLKDVADHVFEIGRKLNIKPEHIEVTAQKYPVRVNSNGYKEVLTYDGIWVLSEVERLFGDYTKVTYRGTEKGMAEVPHTEAKMLDIFSKIFKETLEGNLQDYELEGLKKLQAEVEKKIDGEYDRAIPGMEEVQKVFLDKVKIIKIIEEANKDVIAIKPEGAWILDLQSIEEINGGRVKLDFINTETGERVKGVETESAAIKELKKNTDEVIKYTRKNFNYNEETGDFSPKPGMAIVEIGNEFFNVYFTLSGLIGSARILSSGEFNQLDMAMKVSLVSQLTQTSLGTADLALKAYHWATSLNPESILEPMSKFSRFVGVIAPIFDIVNITTLAISLASASPEEQAQIISNLVLGVLGGALSVLGLVTTVFEVLEVAMDFVAIASEFAGPVGIALAIAAGIVELIFSVINAHKKHEAEYQRWQEIRVKHGLFYQYAVGVRELIKGNWDKFVYIDDSNKTTYAREENKKEHDLIRFSSDLVIKELNFRKREAVIGDVRLDDMIDNEIIATGVRANDFSFWKYDPFCPWSDTDIYDSGGWNRMPAGISFYEVFLQGQNAYKIDDKYIDNSNAIYILPGRAEVNLHQCFGFTPFDTGQVHDTEGKNPSFEAWEIAEGVQIEEIVFNKHANKYRPKVLYREHNGGFGAEHDKEIEYAAIATGLVPEYVPTTIDIKMDENNRILAVSPVTVDDAKQISYRLFGSGSSTVMLLSSYKIKIYIAKSSDPQLLAKERWLFDFKNQPSRLEDLRRVSVTCQDSHTGWLFAEVDIQGQLIWFGHKNTDKDTKVSFQMTFKDEVVSNILFDMHLYDKDMSSFILRHIEFNEEYIGAGDHEKEREIKKALETIKDVFAFENSLMFMFNNEIGLIYDGGDLLLCLETRHHGLIETFAYLQEIQNIVDSATFDNLYTSVLLSQDPEMAEYAIQMTSPDLYDLYKMNTVEKKYYCYEHAPGEGHEMYVRGYEIGIDKALGTPIEIRKGVYKGAKVEVINDFRRHTHLMLNMSIQGCHVSLMKELYDCPQLVYDILKDNKIPVTSDGRAVRIDVKDVNGGEGYIEIEEKFAGLFGFVLNVTGGSILEYTRHNSDEVIIRYKIVSEQSGTRLLFDAIEVSAEEIPIHQVELYRYLSIAIQKLNYGDEQAFISFLTIINSYLSAATNASYDIKDLLKHIKDSDEKGWKEIEILITANYFKREGDKVDFAKDKEEMCLSFNDNTQEVKLNSLNRNYGRSADEKGYEHMYMKIDSKYGTYTEYATLDNRDIEIATGSYSTFHTRRVNSLESKVILLNNERYRGISVINDDTSDVEIILEGDQFYSTNGFNLFLIRQGGKVAMLPGALKPMNKKNILNIDGRKKIDIRDIHKKLRMVEFDSRMVNGTCEMTTEEYVMITSEKGAYVTLEFINSIEIDENSDIIWEPKPRVIDLVPHD